MANMSKYTLYTDCKTGNKFYGYEEGDSYIVTRFREIKKADYDRFSVMGKSEFNHYVERVLLSPTDFAYGYYGAQLIHDEENNMYFLGIKAGTHT